MGDPKILPRFHRKHKGDTYYLKYYDTSLSGWENKIGEEAREFFVTMSVSATNFSFNDGMLAQSTSRLTAGDYKYGNDYFSNDGEPGISWAIHRTNNIAVKNDFDNLMYDLDLGYNNESDTSYELGDGGDRWRTAGFKFNLGLGGVSFNLFTGYTETTTINAQKILMDMEHLFLMNLETTLTNIVKRFYILILVFLEQVEIQNS